MTASRLQALSSARRAREHDAWGNVPGLGALRRKLYFDYFTRATDEQLFRGVFDSMEAALASAPDTKPRNYGNEGSAELYLPNLRHDSFDYSALFWIGESMAAGMRSVFDVGGNIGAKYYAFSKLLTFPADLQWTVQDVPAVAERGRGFAAERGGKERIAFTSDLGACDGMDVLYASGSLQYLPQTLGQLLATLKEKPRRILVNTTPVHPTFAFFTLGNIGTAFCPHRVQAHGPFVREVKDAGYRLRDHWQNVGKAMRIPFERAHDVEAYSGYCFDRA